MLQRRLAVKLQIKIVLKTTFKFDKSLTITVTTKKQFKLLLFEVNKLLQFYNK